MSTNPYPNQYVGGLSPTQKARRWKPKKWFKVRHIEDLSDPRSRLIPIYRGGGKRNNALPFRMMRPTYSTHCAYSIYIDYKF